MREVNKQEVARLKREMREQNKEIDLSKYASETDSGLIENPTDAFTTFYQKDIDGTSLKMYTKMS